jgi:uncharacterized membrane protein YeaQ/YmgE (transglycosylase-associated protein family)
MTTSQETLLIVVAIGIAAGLMFKRYGRGWWSRHVVNRTQSDVTWALVGIAGAFIGFHLVPLFGAIRLPFAPYIAAALGSAIVLWAWRGR